MQETSPDIAFVYKRKRTLQDLIDNFVDLYVSRRIGKRSREFNLRRGGKIAIFANDYIGIHINQYGFFEGSDLDMVFAFLQPILDEFRYGVALDVGANVGNHSIYFSKYFSSVLSFEPHPRIFELLAFNARMVSNVAPFNFGLGETGERLELIENWENMGSSSLRLHSGGDGDKVEVEIRRMDEIELSGKSVAFMKIDVEGFEANVIRGAWGTIQQHQPLILLEQLESEFIGGTTESIEALKSEGYVFCWHEPWATSRGWLERRINTVRNILLGGTYDYNFMTSASPPPSTYEMLIAVPRRFQQQLLALRPPARANSR